MKRNPYMKKSKFSKSQIVGILREVELGAKIGETCRKASASRRLLGYPVHPNL